MERARAGLQKIVVEAIRSAPPEQAPLLAWQMVCGPGVRTRTTALSCQDGILRVEVPSAEWRAQLMELAPRYVAELNRVLGDTVKRIEFEIAGQRPSTMDHRPL